MFHIYMPLNSWGQSRRKTKSNILLLIINTKTILTQNQLDMPNKHQLFRLNWSLTRIQNVFHLKTSQTPFLCQPINLTYVKRYRRVKQLLNQSTSQKHISQNSAKTDYKELSQRTGTSSRNISRRILHSEIFFSR